MTESTDELDVEVLVKGWAAVETRRPERHVTLDWAARTDIGRVRGNTTRTSLTFSFLLTRHNSLFAVVFLRSPMVWAGIRRDRLPRRQPLKLSCAGYFNPTATNDAPAALKAAILEANALIYHAARSSLSGKRAEWEQRLLSHPSKKRC